MSNELMFSDALLQPARAERSADAEQALAAIERLDATARGDRAALERLRTELAAAARAVSEAKAALQALAIKPEAEADGKPAEAGDAGLKTAELGALLDELEHRLDVMTEAAGGPKRVARPVPAKRAPTPAPEPAAAPAAAAALPVEPQPEPEPRLEPTPEAAHEAAPEAQAVSEPEATPLPAISIDRVPTVSAVVSQLGRSIEADEEPAARADFLETPLPQTAAERGIPTVSMLEALVEALTAPVSPPEAEPDASPAPEGSESVLPDLDLAAGHWSVPSGTTAMPDRIEARAGEISQSFAPGGEALGQDGVESVTVEIAALEIAFEIGLERGDIQHTPDQPPLEEATAEEGLMAEGAPPLEAVEEEVELVEAAQDDVATSEGLVADAVLSAEASLATDDGIMTVSELASAAAPPHDTSPDHAIPDHTSPDTAVASGGDAGAGFAPDFAEAPAESADALAAFEAAAPDADTAEPAPMPDAPQPGEELLSSFARTEEYSYLPPEEIGTAVIFSAQTAPGEPVAEPSAAAPEQTGDLQDGGFRELAPQDGGFQDTVLPDDSFQGGDAPAGTGDVQFAATDGLAGSLGGETQPANWPLAESGARDEWEAAADAGPRFPRLPPAPTHDPLAPLNAMSDEEKTALFS